jgi:5-methylcytosine-specific restriction endonuclease McrA
MRYRSPKKEAEYRIRRPLVARLLEERPLCEACPVFAEHDEKLIYRRNASMDVHELVRRSQGGSILDESNLMCVCRPCHTRIGNNPQLAFDLGLAKHGYET